MGPETARMPGSAVVLYTHLKFSVGLSSESLMYSSSIVLALGSRTTLFLLSNKFLMARLLVSSLFPASWTFLSAQCYSFKRWNEEQCNVVFCSGMGHFPRLWHQMV